MSHHFSLEKITDGVYAAIAAAEGGAFGNAGIIDLGDQTLLFDSTFNPASARDLYQAAEKLTGKAPRYCVVSHAHLDHYQGACVFPTDVDILTTPITRAAIQANWERNRAANREQVAEQLRGFVEALGGRLTTATSPIEQYDLRFQIGYLNPFIAARDEVQEPPLRLTFEDYVHFHGTQRQAIAIHLGAGHSDSDVILHLPDDGIVFTGDLLSVGHHPFLGAGDLKYWLSRLDRLEDLNAKTFIPGHGNPGTLDDLHHLRAYLVEMQGSVKDFIGAGGQAEEVGQVVMPARFEKWKFGSWLYPQNLTALYEKLKGG